MCLKWIKIYCLDKLVSFKPMRGKGQSIMECKVPKYNFTKKIICNGINMIGQGDEPIHIMGCSNKISFLQQNLMHI